MSLLHASGTGGLSDEPPDSRPAGVDTVTALAHDYRPIARLESDEWGPAFLAEQIRVGRRRVRIRLFPHVARHHPERLVRLQLELTVLARLTDRHVAAIYGSGETADGTVYVVLEWADGESVPARVKHSGPLPLSEVVQIITQCAGVLDAGRQLGIRHRRLAVDSIVLTQDSEGVLQIKLNDFGLPRPTDLCTEGGESDEQIPSRPAELSAHSDIHSLATVMHVMLTGDPVFASLPLAQSVADSETLRETRSQRPALPDGVEALLARALEPDGDASYRTAADFAIALRQAAGADAALVLGRSSAVQAPSTPIPPWRARRPSLPTSHPESRVLSPSPLFATFHSEDQDRIASPLPVPPASDVRGPTPDAPPLRKGLTERLSRRRLLGELLVGEGLISQIQLEQALRLQAEGGLETPLGQILLEQEIITRAQLTEVLNKYHKKYRLGDLLVETNTITEEQLRVALHEQAATGLRLGEVLQKLDYISDQALREALCKQLGISFLKVDAVAIDQRLAAVIPKDYAREHRVVPIATRDDRLTVVMDDPTDVDVVEELRRQIGCKIEVVTSTYTGFWQAFFWLYEGGHDQQGDQRPKLASPMGKQPARPTEEGESRVSDPPRPHFDAQPRLASGGTNRERDAVPDLRLARLEVRYAALLREHELTVDALREQRELCERLLEERRDVEKCLERLIGGQRTPHTS